ncbi:MAG: alkaline shock response membrane anchor protein AmaP [Actinobacteria bacterium]|nr:alkaline shock response membrane anchor protein AmaP [Actinomycetota bacterium]MBL7060999.1 alkaline shock response membrane anchor protein AmaP [Actinomycetota bacterium]
MNIFNRIVVVILLIFIVVFSIVAGVNKFTNLFIWTDISNRTIVSIATINPYLTAGIFLVLVGICILLLFFEFYRRKLKVAKLSESGTGSDMVTLKALNKRIERSLSQIEYVSNLKVKVGPKKEGIVVNVYTKISRGVNVEKKMAQIREKASEFVTENIGFNVLKTNLTITGFTAQKEIRTEERKTVKEKERKSKILPE